MSEPTPRASSTPQPPTPPSAPAKKGRSPWLWVGLGCGILLLAALVVMVVSGLWLKGQVQDIAENPAVAAARLIAAANPEIELEEVDRDRRRITFRHKETGERFTVDFEDVERGQVRFETEEGEVVLDTEGEEGVRVESPEGTMTFGAGEARDVPAWVPRPPDMRPEGHFTMERAGERSGHFSSELDEPLSRVLDSYQSLLEEEGFAVTAQTFQYDETQAMAVLSATDEARGRTIQVTLIDQEGQTQVSVSYEGRD